MSDDDYFDWLNGANPDWSDFSARQAALGQIEDWKRRVAWAKKHHKKPPPPPKFPWASRFGLWGVPGQNIVTKANTAAAAVKVVPYTKRQVDAIVKRQEAEAKKDPTGSTLLASDNVRKVGGKGLLAQGHFYILHMDFADGPLLEGMNLNDVYPPFDKDPNKAKAAYKHWGESFGNPIATLRTNYTYLVRLRIEQARPEALLQGFKVKWGLPKPAFSWADKYGEESEHVASGNPVVVVRLAKTSSDRTLVALAANLGGFTAQVTKYWEPI